jgi:hypothetical protein
MTHYRFATNKTIGGTLTPLVLNQLQAVVNLSTATEILFYFKKPDGTIIERIGDTLTDGVDGYAIYTFIDGDLDTAGLWRYWIKITAPSFILATDEQKTFMVRED